ncbi:hypothetical protein C8T65DRAFT_749463 [Cerioporus squamosus]|nr:hypothetical protein C8T65DRAFT_749463 [Cerioporus squamosus]
MKLASDTRLFDSGDEESHEKVREMVDIIRGHGGEANALFWHGLARIKRHLEPLAIASHITQADTCRLDDVLLTFGHLYKFYSELDDPVDAPARTAVLRSLEKRWSKADQDVFRDPFNDDLIDLLAPAHVHILADRLWNRFFPHDTDDSKKPTFRMVCDYLEQKGIYAHMKITMNAIAAEARSKGERVDPVDFCILGFIMSDYRTRLTVPNLLNIAELRMHLRDKWSRKETKQRLKNHYGERSKDATPATATEPSDPQSTQRTRADNQEGSNLAAALRNLDRGDSDDSYLPQDFPSKIAIPLSRLFDYSSDFWTQDSLIATTASLEEELALRFYFLH